MRAVPTGIVLILTGLALWIGAVYVPLGMLPGVTDKWQFRLGLVLAGMVTTLFGLRFNDRDEERLERSEGPPGFEVKQIPGTMPGAEEKDIDHG